MSVFHPNDPGIAERVRGAVTVPPPTACGAVPVGPGRLHRLPMFSDVRGSIVVNEAPDDLPFVPTRMFQVFDVPQGELRGDHAHRRCHQFVMALSGSMAVVLDDGCRRFRVELDGPDLGLHIPPVTWAIQSEFSDGARALVLASEPYDRTEYIDDYQEYLALRRRRKLT